jgi:AcrR family transcriptional regulator
MRVRKPGRLAAIAEAALTVFTAKGYRQTQVADVAAESGLSPGALYTYVEGKEALLELAMRAALGLVPAVASDGPFSSDRRGRLVDLEAVIQQRLRWPVLEHALAAGAEARPMVDDVAGELFDIVARERRLIWFLDRCAQDLSSLQRLHHTEIKARYIHDLNRFVSQVSGMPESSPALVATTRGLMEMVAWMGMHRHRDPLPPPVSDADARAAVCRLMRQALDGISPGDREEAP